MRFPGGKEKKTVNWINLKLSKPFDEKMPELEKYVLGFFFLTSVFKTCARNYHSGVFLM